MGLEAATYINDLTVTNPVTGDDVAQGDDHIRLLKNVMKTTLPNATRAQYFDRSATKTADYSVLATDMQKRFLADGTSATVNLTLPSLGASNDGWWITVRAVSVANALTVTPASGTINGLSEITLTFVGQEVLVWWSGTAWYANLSYDPANLSLAVAGLTALSAPALNDSLVIYDLSATTLKTVTNQILFNLMGSLAAETTIALDDLLPLYDLSETAANAMTPVNLLKVLNLLTEDTSPDLSADFVLTYDTSAGTVKKAKPSNLVATPIEVVLDDQSISGATTATFTISGSYDEYEFRFLGIAPDSVNSYLAARFSIDSGVSYDSTSGHYNGGGVSGFDAGSSGTPTGLTDEVMLSKGDAISHYVISGNAAEELWGTAKLFGANSTTQYKMLSGDVSNNRASGDSNGDFNRTIFGFQLRTTSALTNIQFYFTTGSTKRAFTGRIVMLGRSY